MLVLNENDILQAITMDNLIEAIEEAYVLYENNQFDMPTRSQISDNQNTFILMPSIAKKTISLKIVNVFPENRDYPVTQGLVLLNNRENGTTKALLNGTVLTGLRTGAIGGVAIKYLAPVNVQSIGLIGTGYQGLYQLLAACTVRKIKHIYLWNRTPTKIPSFIQKLKKLIPSDIAIHIANDCLELIDNSELVITSTSSQKPILPNKESIYNGKLIIGIGSFQPQMREFSASVYKNLDYLYIDTLDAKKESGDVIDPLRNQWITESQIVSFSKVITKKISPIYTKNRPIVFKSTGMAIFDLVSAEMIYEKALSKQIGQFMDV